MHLHNEFISKHYNLRTILRDQPHPRAFPTPGNYAAASGTYALAPLYIRCSFPFMPDAPAGSHWSKSENELIVADYFAMLALEHARTPFNKSERNAQLQQVTGRKRSSIEFKHQNISAVLEWLGLPWIAGYKPMANYQGTLVDAVERHMDASPASLHVSPPDDIFTAFREGRGLFLEEPPPALSRPIPKQLERIVRKFDPALRDARNRKLGHQGEECIFLFERSALRAAGRDDLAKKVRWVSHEDGDGAGYDIRSFDPVGAERLIEVKTTTGHNATPFLLSENERAFSQERPEAFRLVRLYDFARQPRAFELAPPLDQSVSLNPAVWRATFGNA